MNKVYIVIVNHNKFGDTIECLESLLKLNYDNFQIFVVDNSSDDLSIKQLCDWVNNNDYEPLTTAFSYLVMPPVAKPINHVITDEQSFIKSNELFESKLTIIKATNRGFAAANNLALRYIIKNGNNGSLIWILNNDTVVEKDSLNNLVCFYSENQHNKYIFGSKLKYYHNPDTIQAIAGYYNKWIGKHFHIGNGETDNGQYNNYEFKKTNYVVGASMFLSKLFIEEVGLMSEDYFLYFEELDWMQEGLKHGYKIALVSNAVIYHKEGSAIIDTNDKTTGTAIAEYYSITNRVKFIKKWYPYCLVTVMPGVLWALIKRLMQGKFKLVKKITIAVSKILFTSINKQKAF